MNLAAQSNKKTFSRACRILEIATRMAEKFPGCGVRNHIEAINLHGAGYAEPGYTDPESGVIATGDWNEITEWRKGERIVVSNLPKRIGDLFEKMGIPCEWSDEWEACAYCQKLVRTEPDSHPWKPSYVMGEGEICCSECVEADRTHFVLGSGMNGCLYDNGPHAVETKEAAIESLCETFDDLDEEELRAMRRDLEGPGVHYFDDAARAGADYCEITEEPGPCPDEDEDGL